MRPSPSRLESVDQYRGFATIVMVLMNYFLGLENLPRWLQHSSDVGLAERYFERFRFGPFTFYDVLLEKTEAT